MSLLLCFCLFICLAFYVNYFPGFLENACRNKLLEKGFTSFCCCLFLSNEGRMIRRKMFTIVKLSTEKLREFVPMYKNEPMDFVMGVSVSVHMSSMGKTWKLIATKKCVNDFEHVDDVKMCIAGKLKTLCLSWLSVCTLNCPSEDWAHAESQSKPFSGKISSGGFLTFHWSTWGTESSETFPVFWLICLWFT